MKRIVYTRIDGGVSVCIPCISNDDPKDMTEADALARALKKDIPPDATNVQIVEHTDIPGDRTFRNAWRCPDKKITTHMPVAITIARDVIRRARAPKMADLDIAYQRADEAGDAKAKQEVAARKNALRDAPADPRLSAAGNEADLKRAMLSIVSEIEAQ